MITVSATGTSQPQFHGYLLGAVGPRPIAFASTIDKDGKPNLAPFSFFNVFSSNPPIAIFSPALSGRDGSRKHTLDNVKEVPEVVLNIVNYNMVQQMSLASSPYAKGVDEFEKAGFTKLASQGIKPFRVAEAPVTMECIVKEVIELGKGGGAGNLVVCEVQLIHIKEEVLDEHGKIDQQKIDLVARMGGNWYCRAHGDALFEIAKPITTLGIGVDLIPAEIKNSKILSANNLGQLGSVENLPTAEEIGAYKNSSHKKFTNPEELHLYAKTLLDVNKVDEAWKVLLGN
jgi:flavin reductase (DIM6/NTAB) family NADH-FMN oxidoreductase RutF